VIACSHSEPFVTESQATAVPYENLTPVRLTYNPGNNYWPSWTEDGKGIIYYYSITEADIHADDRCIGLLQPAGGSRLWQMCDERREHADSADSFAGAAIGTDGRLIYLEVSTKRGSGGPTGVNQGPQTTNLWLADTTFPFQRHKLLDLSNGMIVGGTFVNWLRDVQWTGPASFIALAQVDTIRPPPIPASWVDTVFVGVGVVSGTINPSGATLSLLPGTVGAKSYSLAENGASIIFSRSGLTLERVMESGGSPNIVTTIPAASGRKINGLTCRETSCLVATSTPATFPVNQLWLVSLATGAKSQLPVVVDDFPRLSPVSNEMIGWNVTTMVSDFPFVKDPPPPRPRGAIVLFKELLP
jgi:hypothetical protein